MREYGFVELIPDVVDPCYLVVRIRDGKGENLAALKY